MCEICNSTYFRSEHLKRHLISHSEEKKPYKCSMCVTRFSNKSHLNRHVKFVHLSLLINCDFCAEKFSKKSDYHRHMFSHTKTKPFQCYYPFCKRSYYKKGKLQSHIDQYHLLKAVSEDKTNLVLPKGNFSCKSTDTHGENVELRMSDLINKDEIIDELDQTKINEKISEKIVFKCPFQDCLKYYSKVVRFFKVGI
jgi:uncharacterized Zn-finger protein